MPLVSRAETYFIVAMMVLILIICTVACIAFFKTYKKEMRQKKHRAVKAEADRDADANGA